MTLKGSDNLQTQKYFYRSLSYVGDKGEEIFKDEVKHWDTLSEDKKKIISYALNKASFHQSYTLPLQIELLKRKDDQYKKSTDEATRIKLEKERQRTINKIRVALEHRESSRMDASENRNLFNQYLSSNTEK